MLRLFFYIIFTCDQGEKVMVELVAPVLENHHLLLVTLLLTNAAAMEALPVLLDRIMPSYLVFGSHVV